MSEAADVRFSLANCEKLFPTNVYISDNSGCRLGIKQVAPFELQHSPPYILEVVLVIWKTRTPTNVIVTKQCDVAKLHRIALNRTSL